MQAKHRGDLKNSIKLQILYYPKLDNDYETESFKLFGSGFFVNKETCEFFESQYNVPGLEDNIYMNPGKATVEEAAGVPPAVIVVCEADILRSGKINYILRYCKVTNISAY